MLSVSCEVKLTADDTGFELDGAVSAIAEALQDGTQVGQEEDINTVADRLTERGEEPLGRSTVQPTVQAVLDRLRRAEK